MSNSKKDPTYAEIWDNLSSFNVNEHTKEKNGLTYLSWAWAWGIMMEHYPDLEVRWMDADGSGAFTGVEYHPGGTATVHCQVRIGKCTREMFLPVMSGYKNSAVVNPTSRDIGDAKMRCLVKCFAMFGLGHYIYAGEDIPEEESKDYEVEKLIATVKKEGRNLAQAGVAVPDDLRGRTKAAIKNRNAEDLNKVLSEITSLEE